MLTEGEKGVFPVFSLHVTLLMSLIVITVFCHFLPLKLVVCKYSYWASAFSDL